MRAETRDWRPVAGLLLILAITGLAVLIFFLETIQRKAQDYFHVVAVLPQGKDLKAGTPVWIAGKEVGRVLRIAVMPATADTLADVAAVLQVPEKYRDMIRLDTRLRMTKATLMSKPVLDLVPGSPAAPRLGPMDTLRLPPFTATALAMAQAKRLFVDLDSLLAEANQVATLAGERPASLERIRRNVQAARATSGRLAAGDGSLPRLLHDSVLTTRLERVAARSGRIAGQLRARLDALSPDTAAGGAPPTADVRLRLARLAERLDSLQSALDGTSGTLGRLRRDSAISIAVEGVRSALDSLIAVTKANPFRIFF